MAEPVRIMPRPRVRARRFAQRVAPVVVWLGAVAVCVVLLRPTGLVGVRGYAELAEVSLAPSERAMVDVVAVGLHEFVQRGQAVILLDDTEIYTELAETRARIDWMESQVDAERARVRAGAARIESDEADLARALQVDLAGAHVEWLAREAALAADRAAFVAAQGVLEIAEKVESEVHVSGRDLVEDRGLVEQLLAKVERGGLALERARQAHIEADARWAEHVASEAYVPEYDAVLAPVRAAAEVERRKLDGLAYAIERMVIRAPFDGQVVELAVFGGERVQAGQTLARLVPRETSRVVVYMDAQGAATVRAGDSVVVALDRAPGERHQGRVVSLASAVREIPVRHRIRFDQPQWGVGVIVAVPAGLALVPGEGCAVSLGR